MIYALSKFSYSLWTIYLTILFFTEVWSIDVFNYYYRIMYFYLQLCLCWIIYIWAMLFEAYMFIIIYSWLIDFFHYIMSSFICFSNFIYIFINVQVQLSSFLPPPHPTPSVPTSHTWSYRPLALSICHLCMFLDESSLFSPCYPYTPPL